MNSSTNPIASRMKGSDRRLAAHLARSKDDPNYFNDVILRRPRYWRSADSPEPQYPGQAEWCEAIVRYHTVAIETGNMLGKDYWVAGLILWWLWTRKDALVIVTGPGQTTIGSITWKEVRQAVRSCPFANRGLPMRLSEGVKTSPHLAEVRPGWHALGYSTTNVERASGHHAVQLLVIVEEASGVEDEAWEALDSLGASKVAAIGNPLRHDGGFARLCDQGDADARDGIPAHQAVCHFNVPSTASPDAACAEKRTGLAWLGWIAREVRHWGANSLWVLAHIRAIRPKVSADALLPEAWLDFAAQYRRPPLPPHHPVHLTRRISCDLGEGVGRDSSCILVRDDWGILDISSGSALGLAEAAQLIWQKASQWGVPQERITYDRAGIGRDFPLHLVRHGLQRCVGYAGAGTPRSGDFANLRTEAAWRLRQRLEPGVSGDVHSPHQGKAPFAIPAGPHWPRLREELRTLSYSLAGRKTKLLKKEDHTILLGHSPDLSDALVQSFGFD